MSPACQTFYIHTEDGWQLPIYHYPALGQKRPHPVLMTHGFAANHLHFDLTPYYSLARASAARGFATYVLELRGAGLSRAPQGRPRGLQQWGFADYAERDMPSAISFVLEHAGATALHAVGHSMGGMLWLAVATEAMREVRSLVAIGSPLVSHLSLAWRERRLLQLAGSLGPAASLTPPGQKRVPLRRLLALVSLVSPLSSALGDDVLYNANNCEAKVIAMLAKEGINDVPVQLVSELTQHYQAYRHAANSPELPGGVQATFGAYSYEQRLHKITAPALIIAGSQDRIAPPPSVQAIAGLLGSQQVHYREFGRRFGDIAGYGHVDLLLGKLAPQEVYPVVLDFLAQV